MSPHQEHGVYSISVVAELTGVHPQMLRTYEARGLLSPTRTAGGTRRYSGFDVAQIEMILTLIESGLNLEGVQQVMDLQAENTRLRAENSRLRSRLREH